MFYKKEEQGRRISWFYVMVSNTPVVETDSLPNYLILLGIEWADIGIWRIRGLREAVPRLLNTASAYGEIPRGFRSTAGDLLLLTG